MLVISGCGRTFTSPAEGVTLEAVKIKPLRVGSQHKKVIHMNVKKQKYVVLFKRQHLSVFLLFLSNVSTRDFILKCI